MWMENHLKMKKMNDLLNKEHQIFSSIHPKLKNNFCKLCMCGLTSIKGENIYPIQLENSSLLFASIFKLYIPYGGTMLNWEIIFNPDDWCFAPDFIFENDEFVNLDIDELAPHLPSLETWDLNNDSSLENVLKEFLELFKKHQIKQLFCENIFPDLREEFEILTSSDGEYYKNVEIIVEDNIVQFAILLDIDSSSLPGYNHLEEGGTLLNTKEDFSILQLTFHKSNINKVTHKLILSARLNSYMKNSYQLSLPRYDTTSSLLHYINSIRDKLQNEIHEIVNQCEINKNFVTTLISSRANSIIEYDSHQFNSVSFFAELDEFLTLVKINLDEFSDECTVEICSIYCRDMRRKLPHQDKFQFNIDNNTPPERLVHNLMKILCDMLPEHIKKE